MAALTRPAQLVVRAAFPGEGAAVAALWRELWDAHEAWGGYPGSRDPRVYAQLAHRLDVAEALGDTQARRSLAPSNIRRAGKKWFLRGSRGPRRPKRVGRQ